MNDFIKDYNYIEDIELLEHGANFKIGSFNRIGKNVKIGNNVSIGHHCIIEDNVTIGDNVKIENYVFLNELTVVDSDVFIDSYARSSGRNYIGKGSTIRYGVTIAKAVEIGVNVFISPNVMTIYSNHKGEFVKKTIIKDNVFIGTAAVIGPGVTLNEQAVIGAMSYVVKDCSESETYVGTPAKILKKVVQDSGE